jgi:hypothetical protein
MALDARNPASAGDAAGLDNCSVLCGENTPNFTPKPPRNRAPRRIDFGAINGAALANLAAVLARILPSGKQVHREWIALNPRRADRNLGSFKVNLFNGKWADFATGDKGGDPVSLVAYVEGVSQLEAATRLARMLGMGGSHE